jgi:hypothetical protein
MRCWSTGGFLLWDFVQEVFFSSMSLGKNLKSDDRKLVTDGGRRRVEVEGAVKGIN